MVTDTLCRWKLELVVAMVPQELLSLPSSNSINESDFDKDIIFNSSS